MPFPRLFLDDLNHFLANSRIPNHKGRRFKTGGLCQGMAVASIMVDDFEKMVYEFQAATEIERTTPGTPAWMLGYRLVYLLAAAHNMSMPFDNVYFSKQPQTRSYAHLSLKQLGKYTITFNAYQNLTNLLRTIDLENTPIALLFMFEGHTIRIKYENHQFNVYDTVEPSRQFANQEEAARYIFSKYLELKKLPQILTDFLEKIDSENAPVLMPFMFEEHTVHIQYENHQFKVYDTAESDRQFTNRNEAAQYIFSKFLNASNKIRFNATIEILKKESDTSANPEKLLYYLHGASFYSRRLVKGTASVIKHKIQVDDFLHVPDIPMKWFRKEMETHPCIGGLLQTMPASSIKTVLEDPFFKTRLERDEPYKTTTLDEIIKHYKDEPERRLIATCLYLLIKKYNISLEEQMAIDFNNYGDPTLLRVLNEEQLRNIINTTSHLQTKKIAYDAYSKFISDEAIESIVPIESIPELLDLIHVLYFKNKGGIAQHYIEQLRRHPELKSAISYIKDLVSFSIQDKKNDWLEILSSLPFDGNIKDFFAFLKMAIKYENEQAFVTLFKIILHIIKPKELSFKVLAAINPILIAACECSSVFLASMIEHLRAENIADLVPLLINTKNSDGESILHSLVYQGKTKHVDILLKAGASQGLSKYNETPFYLACVLGHVEIARLLFNAHQYIDHTMPPIPNKPNLPYLRYVFEAAKNSNNPDMLNEVINLFLERYTIQEICDFPLHTIPYFLEYFEKHDSFVSLMLAADYLTEKHPIENLLALEFPYLRKVIQSRTPPAKSPEMIDIDELFETINFEVPTLPLQHPDAHIQSSTPRPLHAYNNSLTNTLKRKCSTDALSPHGDESAKRRREEMNWQIEQSAQQTPLSLIHKHCASEAANEHKDSLVHAPGIQNRALFIR